MKESLQILLGLLLVLVLAYAAFLDVSSKIKDDLLTKTKVMFSENNVRSVLVNLQGEGLCISRTLLLTGTAISEVERVRMVLLSEDIEGIRGVNNQIIIHPAVPTIPVVPKVPIAKKSPTIKTLLEQNTVQPNAIEAVSEARTEVSIENKTIIKVPLVPVVVSKSIVVPTPVKAISAPKVIKIEKIKLEGVK